MKSNEKQLEAKFELGRDPIIQVVPIDALVERVNKSCNKPDGAPDIDMVWLLAGERISCCDEGVLAEQEGKFVGAATIAPNGEQNSGQPTVVGLYVVPEFRSKGYGGQILQKAVERCIERGFDKIRMDVLALNAKKIIDKLPENLRKKLDVHDEVVNK